MKKVSVKVPSKLSIHSWLWHNNNLIQLNSAVVKRAIEMRCRRFYVACAAVPASLEPSSQTHWGDVYDPQQGDGNKDDKHK